MKREFHTIVLGMGAMGSAAAYHLAKRGLRVLGLDQADIPNSLGSSHGQSRLIRMAYYEHADYVPLLRRAYALWREMEAEGKERVLHVTGGLYLGPADHELITGSLESALEHGLPHEMLTRAALRKRFAQFRVPGDFAAFYEPEAGFVQPEKAVALHAALAMAHGAELHAHEGAVDWTATGKGVTVRTAHHTYRAERLIITAGAWTSQVLPLLADRLTVTRQTLHWFYPKEPARFIVGACPAWCIATEAGGLVYAAPMLPGEMAPLGLKVAHHFPGSVTTPETVIRTALPGDANVPRRALASYLPEAAGPLLSSRVCMYTMSPDHHFYVDRHPAHENVFFAAGFSGHGFKFSPVIGEGLAALAAEGRTTLPLSFLRLGR